MLLTDVFSTEELDSQVYKCPLDPDFKTTLQVHLFREVKNVEEIRNNILSGTWKCVIIKPDLILHPLQIAVAANKAVVSEKSNTMATRSVYTEILFNLSLTKNISQSLSKFGIEKDTEMLVCFLVTSDHNSSSEIIPRIEGEPCKIGFLCNLTAMSKIKSVYKFNGIKYDYDIHDMLNIIISRISTKFFISY